MYAVSQRELLELKRIRDRMEFEKMQRFGASADETVVESNSDYRRLRI